MRQLVMGLKVGLLVVGLLAVAVSAMASPFGVAAGIGDPLSLAASGVLLPYVNNGANGDLSFVEVANPAPFGNGIPLHMIFFNATCQRVVSVSTPVTANDVLILPLGPIVGNKDGLVAIADVTPSGTDLQPMLSFETFHSRTYWVNALSAQYRSRVLAPIVLDVFGGFGGIGNQGSSSVSWSPLRTGITFFAPPETGALHTVLYMICPKSTIQTAAAGGGVFPWGGTPPNTTIFPRLDTTATVPNSAGTNVIAFRAAYPVGALHGRVYDVDENFLRDVITDCDCWQPKPVLTIDLVYGNTSLAPNGTYTELEADSSGAFAAGDFAFTGYKSINVSPFDLFGRLSGASRFDLTVGTPPSAGNR